MGNTIMLSSKTHGINMEKNLSNLKFLFPIRRIPAHKKIFKKYLMKKKNA